MSQDGNMVTWVVLLSTPHLESSYMIDAGPCHPSRGYGKVYENLGSSKAPSYFYELTCWAIIDVKWQRQQHDDFG
jgi:hypothetical protein